MSYQLLYAGWTCYWFSPSITISNYTRDSLKKSKSKSATTTEAVASALAPPKDVKDLRQIAGYGRVNIFTYSELRAATKNFRLDQILGEGGFGIVYEVGVKELNPDGFQGDKEWLAEVNSLGQLSHSILVFRDLSSNPDLVGSLLESISKLQKLTTLILQELGQSLSDFGKAMKLLYACEGESLGKAFSDLGSNGEILSFKLRKEHITFR